MVMTAEEARQAVDWCRHEPTGRRSTGGWQHVMSWDATADEYYTQANHEVFIAIQIEHIEAVARVDEILAVPGIDAVFVGPMDLSKSMGFAPPFLDAEEPRFQAALEAIRTACERHGVAPGMHCGSVEHTRRKLAEGWRFLAVSSDLGFLSGTAKAAAADLGLTSGGGLTRY